MLLFAQCPLGHGGFDDVHQLQRRLDRTVGAHALDCRRDLGRIALLTVFIQNPAQLVFGIVVDNFIGSQRTALVHAHVQRRVCHIRKAARAVVELRGRNAQIEEHPVNLVQIQGVQDQGNVFKVIMHQRNLARVAAEPLFCRLQRYLVAVDADEPAVCQTAADFQRVPAAAERSVQIDAVRTDVERVDALPKQYRFMRKLHQKPNSSITCARFSGVRVSISSLSYASLSQISA